MSVVELAPRIETCRICRNGNPGGLAYCWNCHNAREFLKGWALDGFDVGAEVLQLPNLSGWVVEKHKRDGTTLLRSMTTGKVKQWNSGANRLWILPQFRDQALAMLRRGERLV